MQTLSLCDLLYGLNLEQITNNWRIVMNNDKKLCETRRFALVSMSVVTSATARAKLIIVFKGQLFWFLTVASAFLAITVHPLKTFANQPSTAAAGVQQIKMLQAIFLGFVQGATEFLPLVFIIHYVYRNIW